MTSEVTHLWACVIKQFLESDFQHKEVNKRKNTNSQQNMVISRQLQIQEIKLFKYYTEKDKKKMDRIVIVRTETCL